jgi:ribonucleoside-triphosphate reductase (thioredoxin)
MDQYSTFIAASRYARWAPEVGRRETWEETVARYVDFWSDKLEDDESMELDEAILSLEVMPSMRCLMTAGAALERDNVAGFNCSYLPIDHPRAFDELMYILLCGTGVGYSVERQYVSKLPELAEEFHETDSTIVVPDSKVGWAKSMRQLVSLLYAGEVPNWDMSKVRPEGAVLKTFGGRASGPGPLEDLFKFTVEVFKGAAGRQLSSLEAHDLCCKIAEVIVVGGVRRSALISLSNPSDGRLRGAKSGQWWVDNGQRALANNSACYTERPEFDFFLDEMRALYESKSGERGVFSRVACDNIVRRNGRRNVKVTVTLDDGSTKVYNGNELVGGKLACELQEGDDVAGV